MVELPALAELRTSEENAAGLLAVVTAVTKISLRFFRLFRRQATDGPSGLLKSLPCDDDKDRGSTAREQRSRQHCYRAGKAN